MARDRSSYHKKYREKNRDSIREKYKLKYNNDIEFRKNEKERLKNYSLSEKEKNRKIKWDKNNKSYRKKYYELNKYVLLIKNKIRYNKNIDLIKVKRKNYRDKNKLKISESKNKYRNKNVIKINYYFKNRRDNDINFRISTNLRTRINRAIKNNQKKGKTLNILGCTIDDFKRHIESNFTEGMNWENYGKWHIDHIIPCDCFDLSKEEAQMFCFHHTNMQPMWGIDNIVKKNTINFKLLNTIDLGILKDKYKNIIIQQQNKKYKKQKTNFLKTIL